MSAPSGPPLPVTLLTGFLGSGKTTLLARLLRHPRFENTAVIVNELGEIGLDHLLVTEGDEEVVLLGSGCLCCTVSTALDETLNDLYFRRARGEIPRFERVVIETTGLADPAPILHLLMTGGQIRATYAVDSVVATVDGRHGREQLERHPEAVKQAAVADRIIVTKTDLARPRPLAALRARLAAINPAAGLREAVHGAIDPGEILDTGLFDPAGRSADLETWLGTAAHAAEPEEGPHDHGRHDARIRAFSTYFEFPVSWAGYASWVDHMRRYRGADLLRAKGLIAIGPRGRPYVVQGVQHVFAPPRRLDAWPSGDHRSRLVLITRDLDDSIVAASLAALRAPAGTQPPPARP